ncbi:lipid storage droplets surface-binding protein 2-like [Neocloeon triangulifer]|uniref:lipid storage droplets surface-binding protein 2-like n=1 Tax=Neocloeon triangulifer TaxID=2078957 RepID=UPI00286F143D|nr:lipid storage droplets surface-binding protein 2-like [Neocloeon triangulifer]
MYRTMQATQDNNEQTENQQIVGENEQNLGSLHLACVDKVSKLPVVEALTHQTIEAYDKVKGSSGVANWTLSTAESTVATVAKLAEQAASKLPQGPIQAVDRTICSGLALVEDKVPIIKEQPGEIYEQAMEKVSAAKNYSWNKANDMLSTKWGTIALSGFDTTTGLINKYLDYYMPPEEGEVDAPVEDLSVDKVGHSLQTVGQLSGKVRSRVYRAVVHQMQGIKQQSEHSIGQMNQLLNLIPKKAEAEEEARKLAHGVSTFLASVPEKVEHLMPATLVAQVKQAQTYAHQMYEGLMSCTLRDVTDSVKEQAGKVQTALNDLSTFSGQIMETFVAKNKEITETGEDVPKEN